MPGAGLLTLEGWGHTGVFLGVSTCVDDAATDYLLSGELPAEGTRCDPDPEGIPFAAPPSN